MSSNAHERMKGMSSILAAAPRRRFAPSSVSLTTPPTRDLIGPPCPLSNLRPTYYAPLFPSLPATPSPHPYSLSEFPTTSPSLSSLRLARVQRQLHAADLEWRLMRYRLDRHDQQFWAATNALFLTRRYEFVRAQLAARGIESAGPGEAGEVGEREEDKVDLADFYLDHLNLTRADYARYNKELWKMQAGLLWPSLKAATRRWRWEWELWRAGEKRQGEEGKGVQAVV